MSIDLRKTSLTAIRLLVTGAFVAAGLAKLAGADMMVATFDTIGVGQWFRHVTGAIEISGAVLLWAPGRQIFGAGLLLATMLGAALAHIAVLGTDTLLPAVVLGLLSAVLIHGHRDQLPRL